MQKLSKLLSSRIFIVSFLIFIQITLISLIVAFLSYFIVPIYIAFLIMGAVVSVVIINRNSNPNFKLAWIIPVLALPVFGVLFYLMFGRTHLNKKNTEKLRSSVNAYKDIITVNNDLIEKVAYENGHLRREIEYIINSSRSNLYAGTQTEFLNPGSVFFEQMLIDLDKAEKYIFLEYFIIGEGEMWTKVLNILKRKVADGVEVRLIFDDVGSINTLGANFPAEMENIGIKTEIFNPYRPSLDVFLNYRDHRKFAIIDGKVAFTGGINIADEYINKKQRFGFWEDACVRLEGDAVEKIVLLYLEIWNFVSGEKLDFEKYRSDYQVESDGLVIPFSDEPLFQELVCENAYINIINNAHRYVYICTPYLILDDVMTMALIRAAKSGVDVKIITPHKPDKKYVFMLTRANYTELIRNGVNIYEFTPGFMHTKMIISDDRTAIVGTSNFDYRSFYMHFENGVWMHNCRAVNQARKSFRSKLEQCEKISLEFVENAPLRVRILRSILKMFAPLF